MKVKIQEVLPPGFSHYKPHSWECELYKEDKNGQILVAVDYYCREKDIKDAKIGDFVAVRLDEKSGKTGTTVGQIVEFIPKKIEVNKGQIAWQAMQKDFKQVFVEKFNKLESKKSAAKDEIKRLLNLNYLPINNKENVQNELVQEAIFDFVLMRDLFVELSVVNFIKVPEQDKKQPLWFFKYDEKKVYDFETAFWRICLPFVRVNGVCENTPCVVFYSGKDNLCPIRIDHDFKILADELTGKIWGANDENTK